MLCRPGRHDREIYVRPNRELVAEGLVGARLCGATSLMERLQAASTRFREAGIDLEKPYLSPRLPLRRPSPFPLTPAHPA